MSMLGRSAWWLPRRPARVLPNVDVEGKSLLERLDESKDSVKDGFELHFGTRSNVGMKEGPS